jgi:hypothetical protein
MVVNFATALVLMPFCKGASPAAQELVAGLRSPEAD